MMYVDSHSHINSSDFAYDREETVERAYSAGVRCIMDVSDDIATTPQITDFCAKHKNIFTTTGVHPEICDKYPELTAETLIEQAQNKYVVGIGECGLDYYYSANNKTQQIKTFQAHIDAARKTDLPLIIHSRNADDDMINILRSEYKKAPFRGEMHCFCSSPALAEFALSIGFYISASGIITFKNSQDLRDIFREIPKDRLLIETDSPYLAPVPYRGKRNEPSFVVKTADVLAEIKNISTTEIAEITANNFFRLFKKVKFDA